MQIFNVQGMSCGHCVKAVTQALQAVDAGARVEIDLASGRVSVQSTQPVELLLAAIRDEGYEAEPA